MRREDEASHAMPQRRPLPEVNPFGFLDYPPDDYYDHPQPRTTCRACPTAKKTAKSKLFSTICTCLQSMDPQQTNASSASSSTWKTNSDTTLPIM
uniref:Uncharacterized protein n=1 Tax=Romanomermis culicivorax TaxID=13658 RepID=A0A915HQE5_ROMCU